MAEHRSVEAILELSEEIRSVPDVLAGATLDGPRRLVLPIEDIDLLPQSLELALRTLQVADVTVRRSSLEDIFVKMIAKEESTEP